jgi:hypothetical protein
VKGCKINVFVEVNAEDFHPVIAYDSDELANKFAESEWKARNNLLNQVLKNKYVVGGKIRLSESRMEVA